MPLVTSALLARQDEQVLEALGAMGIPHMQHRTDNEVGLAVCGTKLHWPRPSIMLISPFDRLDMFIRALY